MISASESKEISEIKTLKNNTAQLRDRFDEDFKKFRGDLFTMGENEGNWDFVTSNRDQAEGWKMVNILASARRKLFIPGDSNDKAVIRDKKAKAEIVANGLLYSYEQNNNGMTYQPMLQALMAFYRVVRGWGAYRLLVLEDDEGYPSLDLAVWDIRNTYWVPGSRRLIKAIYERHARDEEVKDEYKGWNGKGDDKGMVTLYDIWDCSKKKAREAVIAGVDYVKEPTDVEIGGQKLDYLPIRIKAGGTTPLIYDENEDNIKLVGESYLVNNRNLSEIESRLMTYYVTRAGIEAKMPVIVTWDSSKSEKPPAFDSDPFVKGRVIPLDLGKGQGISNAIQMTNGNNINLALAQILRMRNQGGLSSVAFGETDVAMTAFGTDILNKNTREHLWPFKREIEQDYIWMASEIVSQYKNGSYKTPEFEGINSKFNRFKMSVKPTQIDDGMRFDCELIVDELRDRATQSGMAIQEIGAGLLSKKEALDLHQLSEDPDKTLELIAQERADMMFDTPLIQGLLAKVEDYAKTKDPIKKFELEHAFRKLMMLQLQEKQSEKMMLNGGQQEQGAQREGIVPALAANRNKITPKTAQVKIPQPISEAAQNAG